MNKKVKFKYKKPELLKPENLYELLRMLEVYIVDTTNPVIEEAKRIKQLVEDALNEQ